MKIAKGITSACLLVLLAANNVNGQDRIQWLNDIDEARRVASQTSRLVLAHFYTDWCGPCQQLERNVFNQSEFIRSLTINYVPVKLNAETNERLAQLLGVTRFPTDVILASDGKQIYRTVSPSDMNQYISMLDRIAGIMPSVVPVLAANASPEDANGVAESSEPLAEPEA